MSTSLSKLREANKHRFNDYLIQFASSPKFNAALQTKTGSTQYQIVQYTSRYKHQCLQILAYQFSSMGGTNHAKILQLSVCDHYQALSVELDHLNKTGLGLVILDKYNKVCLIGYMNDVCDVPPYSSMNQKYGHKLEICAAALQNDPMYCKYVSSQKHKAKYGEIVYVDKIAMRPDLVGSGLAFFAPLTEIAQLMGYKCRYALHTLAKSIKWWQWLELGSFLLKNLKGIVWKRGSVFDFVDFEFGDGVSIQKYFEQMQNIGFNVHKLKKYNCKISVVFGLMNIEDIPTVEQAIDNFVFLVSKLISYKSNPSKQKIPTAKL